MIATSLLVKICVFGAIAIVAGKVIKNVILEPNPNSKSPDFTDVHVGILGKCDVLSFFDDIEQNNYTGLVVYISPKDSENSIVNHCRKKYQRKFGNKEGVVLAKLDDNKIVKMKMFSFDTMDDELNEMFEEWDIFKTDYRIIRK